jgi:glycosyltransferase involved in cell wall biosynthesis
MHRPWVRPLRRTAGTLGRRAPAARALTAVVIDGHALSDGSQLRGVGTYLKRIIEGLDRRPGISLSVIAAPDAPLPTGVQRIAERSRAPRRARRLEHDLMLPRRLEHSGAEVFHSPAQEPPRRSPVPWVQTLHDLTPLTRPDPLLAADARRWRRIGSRLRHADAIIAVSRFSADEGVRLLALDPKAITVIPHGVDHERFNPGPSADSGVPYLLHVAAWGPHKGFPEALDLIGLLADRGLPHRLVLAGPRDEWTLARIREAVAAAPRPDRVELAGYVDDLPATYRGATAFLMTSRCEGFGLPALEAMACGTPVVAFDNSSIPEVVGGGGVLVADGDVQAMASEVERLIGSATARDELSERGVEQAARFRWADAVETHAAVLESVAR